MTPNFKKLAKRQPIETMISEDLDLMEIPTQASERDRDQLDQESDQCEKLELTSTLHQFSVPLKVVGNKLTSLTEQVQLVDDVFIDEQPTVIMM